MKMKKLAGLLLCGLLVAAPRPAQPAAPGRDGSHDFDFELGTWRTEVSRLPSAA